MAAVAVDGNTCIFVKKKAIKVRKDHAKHRSEKLLQRARRVWDPD